MRTRVMLLVIILISFIFFSCSEDSTGPDVEIIATEIWDIVIDNGQGSGEWTLELMSDSTIVCSGTWVFNDVSRSQVSCEFTDGIMTLNGSDMTINAEGTAHHNGINQDSDFTIVITGFMNYGQGSGEYEIDFAQSLWPDQDGVWAGILVEGEGVTPKIQTNDFIMHFQGNYIRDHGWVILQLDNEIFYEEVNGDETIVFENINAERGNVITIYTFYNETFSSQDSYILADINVTLGEWTLKGYNYSSEPIGEAYLEIDYQPGDYDRYIVSPTNTYISGGSLTSPLTTDIYYLDYNNKISIFNAIYNADTNMGYCDWIVDEEFDLYEVNYYSFDLDNAMQYSNIQTNLPVEYITLYSYRNNMWDNNVMYYDSFWNDPITNIPVFYTDVFPKEKYSIYLRCYEDLYSYSYNYISENIPSSLNIPEGSISADFNYNENKFENIQLTGNADQISARWNYSDYSQYISYVVYAHIDQEQIEMPEIPNEILADLNFDLNSLEMNCIGLADYDTSDNFDDIIDMLFYQLTPFVSTYNESYHYYQYDDNEKIALQKKRESKEPNHFIGR